MRPEFASDRCSGLEPAVYIIIRYRDKFGGRSSMVRRSALHKSSIARFVTRESKYARSNTLKWMKRSFRLYYLDKCFFPSIRESLYFYIHRLSFSNVNDRDWLIISLRIYTRTLAISSCSSLWGKDHSSLWIRAEGPRIPTTGQQILIFAVISQRGELSTRADSHLKSLYTNREHFFIRRRFAHPPWVPSPNMGPAPIASLVFFPRLNPYPMDNSRESISPVDDFWKRPHYSYRPSPLFTLSRRRMVSDNIFPRETSATSQLACDDIAASSFAAGKIP